MKCHVTTNRILVVTATPLSLPPLGEDFASVRSASTITLVIYQLMYMEHRITGEAHRRKGRKDTSPRLISQFLSSTVDIDEELLGTRKHYDPVQISCRIREMEI